MFKPSSNSRTGHSKVDLLLWIIFYLCFVVVFVILFFLFLAALWLSVGKGLTSWLSGIFSCAFVTCPYGTPCQVGYLIVSIPDLCLLPYIFIFQHFRYGIP